MQAKYKRIQLPKINKLNISNKEHKYIHENQELHKYNRLKDYDPFYQLIHWEDRPLEDLEEVIHAIYDYFLRDGAITFSFIEQKNICPILFQRMKQARIENPNIFNYFFDTINQIIFHTPEIIDLFEIPDCDDSIFDLLSEIFDPFFNVEIIECNDIVPELFSDEAFNSDTLDYAINILYALCNSSHTIKQDYQKYMKCFLTPLSNILKMKTSDNQLRDLQIIDCLYLFLSKSPNSLLNKRKEITIIFQAYLSVFERFDEDQTCIDAISHICLNLSELLDEESSMIKIFCLDGFFKPIPFILDYIFSNYVDPATISSIIYFVFDSISQNEQEDDINDEDEIDELSIISIVNKIADLIGDEYHMHLFYEYILNTTVRRLDLPQQDVSHPLFSSIEERVISYIFDLLENIIILKQNPIIEYERIDELFGVINDIGCLDLKISFNNFFIGLIQNLQIDQLHQFLRFNFMPDLFFSFISTNSDEADFIIDAIRDILVKLNIENKDIISAYNNRSNITDNEIFLVVQVFPDVLESFLDYNDGNEENAISILNKYYSGMS